MKKSIFLVIFASKTNFWLQWPVPLITYSEYNYQHAFRMCYGIINKIPAKYHGSCIQNT